MRSPRPSGFTLLELMIVVAVIAILAMIAIPSYTEQVRKGKRADAVRAIGELQLALERWRSENPCYGAPSAGTCSAYTASGTYPAVPLSNYYTITISGEGPTAYVITATRKGDLANDPKCGNFILTMATGTGTKSVSTGDAAYCWRQ